jgi:hypothetical protein
MGKKSRLKRERRKEQSNPLMRAFGKRNTHTPDYDADFQRCGSQLCDLFSRYNAEDAAVALGVSDLWLPNISSQVKHHFALGVFAAMPPERFTPSSRLNTYEEFCRFIQAAQGMLPSFPSLEDFIPEPDWGEVRVASRGALLRIFYGSSVERIPDFIEAFRLRYEDQLAALNDMDFVIALQHRLISSINEAVIGRATDIESGHVEIPSEAFWLQCRRALESACLGLSTHPEEISPELIMELGGFKRPATWSAFGDAVMTGTSLSAVFIRIGGKRIPLSIRNATSLVVDFWANRSIAESTPQDARLSRSVANYLSLRFQDRSLVSGPLKLISRTSTLSHRFAAVVLTKQRFYLIAVFDVESLPTLGKMEREVHKLLASGEEWGIRFEGRPAAIQLRSKNGTQPGAADIVIIAVLSRVATTGIRLPVTDTTSRVISLPEFVTVFDSLEDAEELDKFWAYVDDNEPLIGPMLGDTADLFGSFRDSNALLVDGALTPTFIHLDPHWGSNWRYKVLKEFWSAAPMLFPDDTLAWTIDTKGDDPQRLIAKGSPTLAWSTTVHGCAVHIMFRILDQELDLLNGRLLEQFVHCFADSVTQRRVILEKHPLFQRSRIVLLCRANSATLATEGEDETTEGKISKPLLSGWRLNDDDDASNLFVTVDVNLARLLSRLNSPCDASFEVECVSDGIEGISSLMGLELNSELRSKLIATSSRRPRFVLKQVARLVDVPDYSAAEVPTSAQYKVARRELAVVLKNLGVEPGRYELAQAKAIIDPARDALRAQIHQQIAAFDRHALLLYCIEQHDALTAEYRREVFRITQSLEHEVSFDRSDVLAEAHDTFTRGARNYRYLLECCASASQAGSAQVSAQEIVQLVAVIDWLFVLYGASDVLHNDIGVAGMEIDHSFIPHVFYSDDQEARKKDFSLEMADVKLRINLLPEDEVTSTQVDGRDWGELDQAFVADLGFSFTHLTQAFQVLAQWRTMGGEAELRLSYRGSASVITALLRDLIQDLTDDEAKSLVNFMTLDPAKIRRLLGKSLDESDVPVWEHNKRGHRYTIRPLITTDENHLAWGAAAADQAAHIWTGSISNGYLPAEFNWPHVTKTVGNIKVGIERRLEVRAFEVCSRATPWLLHGVDFKSRFPKERFEEVGDFDVLAYWPECNRWLSVECKYNKPPFCLKDARRLRKDIFGSGSAHGQFAKIERRCVFLASQIDRLRTLLGWPAPTSGTAPIFDDIYVSRDIYWWMRNPPYMVKTHFVRVDGLDHWLRTQGLLVDHPTPESSMPG